MNEGTGRSLVYAFIFEKIKAMRNMCLTASYLLRQEMPLQCELSVTLFKVHTGAGSCQCCCNKIRRCIPPNDSNIKRVVGRTICCKERTRQRYNVTSLLGTIPGWV